MKWKNTAKCILFIVNFLADSDNDEREGELTMGSLEESGCHQVAAPDVVLLSLTGAISDIPTVSFYIHKDAMSLYNIFFYIIPSKK